MILYLVIFGVAIALLFDFLNGMNDAANSIATIVSTKVLSPLGAVAWAAFFNFAAYFIFGVGVAATIGKGIVDPKLINVYFILAALIGAIIWTYVCTHYGMPISVSHALIGGLIGPGLVAGGLAAITGGKILMVLLFIVLSPLIGLILGYLVMILVMHLFRSTAPLKVDGYFRVLQLASSAVFSLGHGSNDAQKTMGIIWALLIGAQILPQDSALPHWVIISCYSAIALGTLTGGWKVIKTLGVGLTDLKPVGGFCAETAGAITVIGSSLGGIPVSTTHTITGSIMGVGLTRRLSAVRWGVAGNIVTAWVLTIPATMLLSGLIYAALRWFFM